MENVTRRIEVAEDASGRTRSTQIWTVAIADAAERNRLLERLDKALELIGCGNVLCHEAHWLDENGIITICSRSLPTLRQTLSARQTGQPELICLSSDAQTAREQLLAYQDRLRLPDETIVRLGLDICHALTHGAEQGLTDCGVTEDSIYVTASGRWLLGDMGIPAEGPTGAMGLAKLLYRLLGGTDGEKKPPLGGDQLRHLVGQAYREEMDLKTLCRELEWLAEYRPEPQPMEEPKPEPTPEEDSALDRLLAALTEMEEDDVYNPWVDDEDSDLFSEVQEPEELPDLIRKKVHLSSMISAGDYIAALNKYGAVYTTRILPGVQDWRKITAISTRDNHLLGLQSDGSVLAYGGNWKGQCDVSDWTDIIQISAGMSFSAGLRSDGTMVIAGSLSDDSGCVNQWNNIAAIAAGDDHVVGLRKDGTVVAAGGNLYGQCCVMNWTDIVAISAGGAYTIGLRMDGTVVAVGSNRDGQCNVEHWTDIIAVDAGPTHAVGLKVDGTVIISGHCPEVWKASTWTDIIAVSAGWKKTVGLRADGRLLAFGENNQGECDVEHWTGLI